MDQNQRKFGFFSSDGYPTSKFTFDHDARMVHLLIWWLFWRRQSSFIKRADLWAHGTVLYSISRLYGGNLIFHPNNTFQLYKQIVFHSNLVHNIDRLKSA